MGKQQEPEQQKQTAVRELGSEEHGTRGWGLLSLPLRGPPRETQNNSPRTGECPKGCVTLMCALISWLPPVLTSLGSTWERVEVEICDFSLKCGQMDTCKKNSGWQVFVLFCFFFFSAAWFLSSSPGNDF